MKKYELTSETIETFGHTLRRIKALVSFGDVSEGELGGFVETEENLDHSGNAWVYGDAQVCGRHAICLFHNIGSRNDTVAFFLCDDKKIRVSTGCFRGDIDEFCEAVQRRHGDNEHGRDYRKVIEFAKEWIEIPENTPQGQPEGISHASTAG